MAEVSCPMSQRISTRAGNWSRQSALDTLWVQRWLGEPAWFFSRYETCSDTKRLKIWRCFPMPSLEERLDTLRLSVGLGYFHFD